MLFSVYSLFSDMPEVKWLYPNFSVHSKLSKNIIHFWARGTFSQNKAWKIDANSGICSYCVLPRKRNSHIPPSGIANEFF